jgi:deoxycytidylate deaminase
MCCRDYLQEQYAGKLKNCPNCGEQIVLSGVCSNPACKREYTRFIKSCRGCGREVETTYQCPKCETKVFDTYIPGSRESPGKLLDMCRALHAEEITLLNLGKHGRKSSDNLILYITTQPCNLCSNKIVAAGIKKVVFDEPYPMPEALDILASGKVQFQRFQGIKSTAYFRLYR